MTDRREPLQPFHSDVTPPGRTIDLTEQATDGALMKRKQRRLQGPRSQPTVRSNVQSRRDFAPV
jgi:hypothetical protein